MVTHPVTQVIGEQAIVDILDLSKVAWAYWGCTKTSSGLGAEDGEGFRPLVKVKVKVAWRDYQC